MTRTKRIPGNVFTVGKYPFVFQQVLQHFESGMQPLTFEFLTEEKAHQIRFTWYNFTRALKAHGMERQGAIADGVMVKKRGNALIFTPRDTEPDFALMEQQMMEQLGGLMPAPPMTEELMNAAAASEADMMKWLKKSGGGS